MRHGILFFSLLASLILAAGGVFVLLNQGGTPAGGEFQLPEVESSSLLAGLSFEGEKEEFAEDRAASSQVAALPSGNQTSQSQPLPSSVAQPQGKININTAGYEELQSIAGVGPVTARRILDYRNAYGLFYALEDIKKVAGIGEATFEKLKNEITVGDVPQRPVPPQEQEGEKQSEELIGEEGFKESSQPPSSPAPQAPSPPAVSFPININTADHATLQLITGIGPVLAQRIIDYRQNANLFYRIEDIKNVSGIGNTTFEKMKGEITVGNVTAPIPTPAPTPPPPLAPQPSPSPPPPAGACQEGQINVNTASLEEIVAAGIHQIGPSRAEQLIELRPFSSLQDLTRITGISDVRAQEIIEQGIACVQ